MKLDRENLKDIHSDINEALSIIAKKKGLDSISIGSMSFSDNKFTTRITGISSKEDLKRQGLPIGKKFTNLGKEYTIVDVKQRSPKYPIIAEDISGKKYKFPMSVSTNLNNE